MHLWESSVNSPSSFLTVPEAVSLTKPGGGKDLWALQRVSTKRSSRRGGWSACWSTGSVPTQRSSSQDSDGLRVCCQRLGGSGSVTNLAKNTYLPLQLPPLLQCLAVLLVRCQILLQTLDQACFFLSSVNHKLGFIFVCILGPCFQQCLPLPHPPNPNPTDDFGCQLRRWTLPNCVVFEHTCFRVRSKLKKNCILLLTSPVQVFQPLHFSHL